MNVNQDENSYPEELRSIATSLFIESGKKINRAELIRHVLANLEHLYDLYLEAGFYPIKILWESYAVSIGKMITARMLQGNIYGKALGITDDGVLMIEDLEGEIHYIYSADIEL